MVLRERVGCGNGGGGGVVEGELDYMRPTSADAAPSGLAGWAPRPASLVALAQASPRALLAAQARVEWRVHLWRLHWHDKRRIRLNWHRALQLALAWPQPHNALAKAKKQRLLVRLLARAAAEGDEQEASKGP
eukprot:CAMPEP_0171057460 /NCGR_PEP_ID=MMETSP0766_2-20121228/1824_1 /TAXON_ID=439317 /ORGANISM="Gambierdiscus australes, Strain CAWD 149" /LENGTH=132 /DNA_ID=CAMNT_0011512587 /DNA_START=86 /DNA_END=484 /DNA_ORIENTATION=-